MRLKRSENRKRTYKYRPRLISNELFPRWEEKDLPAAGTFTGDKRGVSNDKNEIPRVLAAIYLVW